MESKRGYLGFVGYQEWAKSDFFFESGVMMMRRKGKVEKNSIWRGKDGLLEAREPAGFSFRRPGVGGYRRRRCVQACAGVACLLQPAASLAVSSMMIWRCETWR
ncbi:hypothetical protein BO83DRAFT_377884 [Aspergillus eucalypticola CBS 122712]|uniref:Uncharacterized protein n=1 Tax=Aspergillus eucalypticola (strain CBS 122712 / IBT 29274) TaxID=1448314 RepID=A0A317VMN4_ASPEC|nr:uncharacterized protein BO83DRAFT_377884 [Aspergillus eucalypticola CBS 122712]PWY74829.1 hypothetical protein BO83DRAFT_377884 [Aspergillus eucalypticola CBS 122712]